VELCRWPIPPWGWGSPGRGERPFPCRSRFPLNGIYRSPPPEGAGSAWRLTRWPCTERKQDLRRFLTDALVDALQGTASMENPPRGRGSPARGERPFPCRLHLTLNGFRWNTPTARPLRGLLPPPTRGRAVDWRLARIPCPGGRKQDFGRVFTSSRRRVVVRCSQRREQNAVSEHPAMVHTSETLCRGASTSDP
jgi:hypothetical protein